MFWWIKLVLHLHIFSTRMHDKARTGNLLQVKSTKPHVQNQPGSNLAFSQFVSSSPSRLFVFFSQSLPQPLVSSSAGQSVSSEVFISTAGLPVCRKDKQLFKCLRSFRSLPPHLHLPSQPSFPQNFSSSSHCTGPTLLLQPAPSFNPLSSSCFSSLHVAANQPARFLLLSRLPGDWGDCAQQNIMLLWSGQEPVRHAGLWVPFGCHSAKQQGLADKLPNTELGGPLTARWKWASHWETWSCLHCSHGPTQKQRYSHASFVFILRSFPC